MAGKRKSATKGGSTSAKKHQIDNHISKNVVKIPSDQVSTKPTATTIEEESFPRGHLPSAGKRDAESIIQRPQHDDLFSDRLDIESQSKKRRVKTKSAPSKSPSKKKATHQDEDEFGELGAKGGVDLLHFKVCEFIGSV